MSMSNIYWTTFYHENWQLYMAATDEGLCYVGTPNASFEELTSWVKKRFPGVALMKNDAAMAVYSDELSKYLSGELQQFGLPLHLIGTPFQMSVWEALQNIPHGRTCSYSDVAAQLGKERAVRAVGTAIGANPVLFVVPCHRVVGKDGSLTGYRGGMDVKEVLLKLEGVL
ncbi:methylated-DNA-[protein]-cysteine S-methyltransferase [Paenibacillus taihuensis]|uniref:methylated-DNA--[protein]-cysteine S-methyltransferase n=1 Tax=Paenibacillus taihuensis TaxID=1156355 RepID=A0A3D9RKT1_9BACL|nr:methylated-DNA--[protein]-cysteine S-methyltransferase [Paenibacillus taihuensis]REE80148.1 methylated-DNA-[protein]-cysteine S-methyltransferase [Paenibacillus taihuensis]